MAAYAMIKFRTFIFVIAFLPVSFVILAQQNANPGEKKQDKKESENKVAPKEEKKDEKVVKKEEELARVVILPFRDRTNSKNFQYMSESLSDAISTSMLKNFSYTRINPDEVKKATYDAEQYVIKNKIIKKSSAQVKKGEKTDAELQLDEDQLSLSKRLAKNLKSEIVIYGHYTYDNVTNELVFSTAIYLVESDAVKELEATKNVVDNTIFKATNKVAKNLVDTINVMIEEASGTKKTVAENEKDKKSGEKKALTKKVGQTTPDWSAKKFLITFGAGNSLIPAGKTENTKPNEYNFNVSTINVRFWPIRSLQTTLEFGHLGLDSNTSSGTSSTNNNSNSSNYHLEALDLMLFGGYGLTFEKRLYTYIDVGAGYYVGSLAYNKFDSSGQKSTTTLNIKNPVFGARWGIDLLLMSFLSAGFSTTFQVYYDKPNPIYNLNLMFNVGATF
jgi:hypothetical protein